MLYAVDSFRREGGDPMEMVVSFLLSIIASITAYYICKWLDSEK